MDGEIDRENRDYIYGLDRSIRLERLISLIDRYMDRIDRGRVGTLVPNPPNILITRRVVYSVRIFYFPYEHCILHTDICFLIRDTANMP